MPEFLTLQPPIDALQHLLSKLMVRSPAAEIIESRLGLGRVTAKPILAPHPLPTFRRSTVDGYVLHAADTFGATESLPMYLRIAGEILMGAGTNLSIMPGYCALIHTGGMLPDGADAVVMLEYIQVCDSGEIEIHRSVAINENIIQVGEDVSAGEEVIREGVKLRPAEIGGLMALGLTQVAVVRKPKIGIISSGDEIATPGLDLLPGQVYDINGYTLGGLVEDSGGAPVFYGIIPDNADKLRATAEQALKECEAVVITAGSSASARDLTAQVIQELGEPGVLIHGINIRPGKPTILALCKEKAVIGLPGNPVSALVVASLFVVPIIGVLLGLRQTTGLGRRTFCPSIHAKLSVNIPSQAGREDWIPVHLLETSSGMIAEPLFGKSNLIFTLVRADGFIYIPPDITGIAVGEIVEVIIQ